jgi:hypothetical protein
MTHELTPRHSPSTVHQIRSCDGREHATHREITGLSLFFCNCGYNSGWVPSSELPLPSEFFDQHTPPGAPSAEGV